MRRELYFWRAMVVVMFVTVFCVAADKASVKELNVQKINLWDGGKIVGWIEAKDGRARLQFESEKSTALIDATDGKYAMAITAGEKGAMLSEDSLIIKDGDGEGSAILKTGFQFRKDENKLQASYQGVAIFEGENRVAQFLNDDNGPFVQLDSKGSSISMAINDGSAGFSASEGKQRMGMTPMGILARGDNTEGLFAPTAFHISDGKRKVAIAVSEEKELIGIEATDGLGKTIWHAP